MFEFVRLNYSGSFLLDFCTWSRSHSVLALGSHTALAGKRKLVQRCAIQRHKTLRNAALSVKIFSFASYCS